MAILWKREWRGALSLRLDTAAVSINKHTDEATRLNSIRCAVLVMESPLAVGVERGLKIVVRIIDGVALGSIANFQVNDIFHRSIDKLMRIAAAGPKPGAHAGG